VRRLYFGVRELAPALGLGSSASGSAWGLGSSASEGRRAETRRQEGGGRAAALQGAWRAKGLWRRTLIVGNQNACPRVRVSPLLHALSADGADSADYLLIPESRILTSSPQTADDVAQVP
jgi:hypothetical protein